MPALVGQPPKFHVVRFEASRTADFYAVHSAANGADWCYCTAWWTPTWDGWGERSAEQNRAARSDLLRRSQYDGYLLYVEEKAVGWCQVGPRDRLAKLVEQFQLQPDPGAWAVTCFLIAPSYRRQGLAAQMLNEVVRDLRHAGVKRVEVFPRRGRELDEYDLWNGPEDMFLEAGFEVVVEDPARPVLALDLGAEGGDDG
jgi:ribosomal protein S18 acetylase RimI-like enzyme